MGAFMGEREEKVGRSLWGAWEEEAWDSGVPYHSSMHSCLHVVTQQVLGPINRDRASV